MGARPVGTVMRSTGSWYDVAAADGELFKARVRGRLRLAGSRSTNPVVVGDEVEYARDGNDFWIEAVRPRRNYVIRRSTNLSRESHIIAANVDSALIVATLAEPRTNLEFIDRVLVTCEAYSIPATIVLNKIDLLTPGQIEHFVGVYRSAGYDVVLTSALSGQGVEELRALLRDRTTLLAGNSGVGKSTLIGAVSPGLDIRTGSVSRAHGKGMHTTTFSTMYALSDGYIIDTPGVKGFGLVDIEAAELARYFPEMLAAAAGCDYHNCTHTHEPGCAVVRAVDRGAIARERYVSYRKMLEEDGKHR